MLRAVRWIISIPVGLLSAFISIVLLFFIRIPLEVAFGIEPLNLEPLFNGQFPGFYALVFALLFSVVRSSAFMFFSLVCAPTRNIFVSTLFLTFAMVSYIFAIRSNHQYDDIDSYVIIADLFVFLLVGVFWIWYFRDG